MPKLLGVYIKTSWILFLSITIGEGKESILLRWLEPENGQPPEKWLPDEKLRQQIRAIVEKVHTMNRLQNFDHSITLDNDSVWPSTPMAWPEMPAPISDAKKITIFAISSAVTNRRREVWHS